ncbi:MAG: hypothetical protein CL908_09240 [Deltaproteobacteria bacterium]|nr:hypothetical protein [Deltaproteobacteria bacterium]
MKRMLQFFSVTLLGSVFLLTGSLAQAATISATADALGIRWTLTATATATATATDETIRPTWITTAEARVVGLEEFMLVSAPGGVSGWYDLAGPSANGCGDVNDGFACAEARTDSDAAVITSGASHTWTWVGNVTDLEAVFAADWSGLERTPAYWGAGSRRAGATRRSLAKSHNFLDWNENSRASSPDG